MLASKSLFSNQECSQIESRMQKAITTIYQHFASEELSLRRSSCARPMNLYGVYRYHQSNPLYLVIFTAVLFSFGNYSFYVNYIEIHINQYYVMLKFNKRPGGNPSHVAPLYYLPHLFAIDFAIPPFPRTLAVSSSFSSSFSSPSSSRYIRYFRIRGGGPFPFFKSTRRAADLAK